jgi:hypothetical protein
MGTLIKNLKRAKHILYFMANLVSRHEIGNFYPSVELSSISEVQDLPSTVTVNLGIRYPKVHYAPGIHPESPEFNSLEHFHMRVANIYAYIIILSTYLKCDLPLKSSKQNLTYFLS